MTKTCRVLFVSVAFTMLCLVAAGSARADTVSSNTIIVFGNTFGSGPNDTVAAGTFTFTIPVGHSVTSATFSGSGQYNLSFGSSIDLQLDGNIVKSFSGVSASDPFNVTLNPIVFSFLGDGTANLTVAQNRGTFGGSPFGGNYNLFGLQLTITTAPSSVAVPEPATLLLLGTGLAGISVKVRRRRK